MRKILIISIITSVFLIYCRQTTSSDAKISDGLNEYIKTQKDFSPISSTDLPDYIKSHQPLILDFFKTKELNPEEYFVSTEILNHFEDDKLISDTSQTHLSLRFYHLDYFAIIYQDSKDFLKDSSVTFRKGNIGGKNFSINIDKTNNKISGPRKWK